MPKQKWWYIYQITDTQDNKFNVGNAVLERRWRGKAHTWVVIDLKSGKTRELFTGSYLGKLPYEDGKTPNMKAIRLLQQKLATPGNANQ